MSSEPKNESMFQRIMREAERRESWLRENPELARDWSEAIALDVELTKQLEKQEAERHARESLPDKLRKLGLPEPAIRAQVALRRTDAVEAAGKFMGSSQARFLLLLGRARVGKTTAAVFALGRHLALAANVSKPSGGKQLPDALFVRAGEFARISAYSPDDRQWFEEMRGTPFLLLDDLGTEHLTEFGMAMLQELLDVRYGGRGKTVLTSNLGVSAFKLRYGERIAARIRETGVIVTDGGEKTMSDAKTIRPPGGQSG